MSDFMLEYDIMELVVEYSKALGKQANEYGESLDSKIRAAIGNVTGDSSGNLTNASDSVGEKIKALKQKSEAFYQFAAQISNLLEVAQQTDQEVADAIAAQKDRFLDHHKSLRIENWKEKLLDLLVDLEISSALLTLISKILKVLSDIVKSSKDTIKDWYKSAEGKAIRAGTPVGIAANGIPGWMPYGNEKFPGSKNGKGIEGSDLKDTILKWYEYPGVFTDMANKAAESGYDPDSNLLPYERDLKSLVNAVQTKRPLNAVKYFGKYLWDRYPVYYSSIYTQMGIATGMDPETAKMAGDFASMTLLEGFGTAAVNGIRGYKDFKAGETVYRDVALGSGAGSIANGAKTGSRAIVEGGAKAAEGSGKIKSIDEILQGAKDTTNNAGVAHNFEKSGGFKKTLEDFEALNPSNVKDIQTQYGSGKVGTLSDGTKVVARPGSKTGGSTLEIKISSKKIYKIRY